MAKIILDVPDAHTNTVMTILKSLKSNLIVNIQTDEQTVQPVSSSLNTKHKRYEAKANQTKSPSAPRSRYLSPEEFKKKLTRKD